MSNSSNKRNYNFRVLLILGLLFIGVAFLFLELKNYETSSVIDKKENRFSDSSNKNLTIDSRLVINENQFDNKEKYEEVSSWIDGSVLQPSKVDNIVYFKKDDKFYKRKFQGPVLAEWFGAIGDGKTDDTQAIQKMINSNYPEVGLDSNKTYLVTKNQDLPNFPNNDQPCLLIANKNDFKFLGNGSKLIVKEHAQGILEIQKSTNIQIKDLKVIGAGNFPKIDGKSGYSEKGIAGKGYQTSGFWGYYKNNSKNTTQEYRGGFNNNFPQFGSSSTSSTWGKWNGGYIGNVSYGILIHNASSNIKVENCEAEKFNYVGIGVGHNGDIYPRELAYPKSTNITFVNCKAVGNYGAGFHSMDVDGFKLISSTAIQSGHPSSSIYNETSNPGYGYTARGSSKFTINGLIEDCIFDQNKRKGMDIHAGKFIVFRNNKVSNSDICGIYAAWTSEKQPTSDISIINNTIINCGKGSSSLGAIYVGANGKTQENKKYLRAIIKSNKISDYAGSAIRVRYGNTVTIEGNTINNAVKGACGNLSAILVVGQNEQSLSHTVEIFNNSILDRDGLIKRGIQVSNSKLINVENNKIDFQKDVENAIYVRGSNAIFLDNNDISLRGKGNRSSVPNNITSKSRIGTGLKK